MTLVPDSAFRLDGRVAVVTGGSRGIGRAIALALAEAGADVVVASRKVQDLEPVAEEIRQRARAWPAVPVHPGRRPEIDRLFETTLATFGRLDVLVNNAATNPVFGPLLDIEEEAWDRIMALNVKGYLLAAQRAARAMTPAGRGAIVNIASTAGLRASAGLGAYSVSKAAVIMLTRVLGRELAPLGIRVNGVAPALIETRFSEALWKNSDILSGYLKSTPLARAGRPDEVAGAVVYLCSDAASYVTGQTLLIDGGHLA